MWYLRQRGSQSTICCVFLSQRLWTLNCVRATADTHTHTQSAWFRLVPASVTGQRYL